MLVSYCTKNLDVSEYQLAAMLGVKPSQLFFWETETLTTRKVGCLAVVIATFRFVNVEGKVMLNLLNESLDDGDCILGIINSIDSIPYAQPADLVIKLTDAVKKVTSEYRDAYINGL